MGCAAQLLFKDIILVCLFGTPLGKDVLEQVTTIAGGVSPQDPDCIVAKKEMYHTKK